jgi:TRAP transporter 4TM/12TM fusion protein
MASENVNVEPKPDFGLKVVYWLSLGFVLVGLLNSMPGIPGLDTALLELTGSKTFTIRKYPYEYFYPIVFAVMMLIVVLKHSMWRDFADRSPARRTLGLCLDIALAFAALTISVTYIVEIESICLIDQFTGERAELIAKSLAEEREFADLYGLPVPDSVEDPQCINTTGGWLAAIIGLSVVIFLAYNVKVWGLPLVLVAIAIAGYTIITVLVWYFHGAEDINKYLMTKLGGEPRLLSDGRPKLHDALINNSSGLLGRFIDIILNSVFPYIVLGGLFGASAGGKSLIKLAFLWTRRLRGGPAHAAIVSSAMFGTISGGPVVNVLSTGVLTIPMMIRRGFSKVFAGGMEAAASSGGSIMPPVMGVAAFVLAALTAVPYREVIVAAAIPALAYFFCLFLTAVFQSRKQGIEAVGEVTDEMRLSRQDKLNLVMIFGPILMILFFLLTPKEQIGCGPFGWLLGAQVTFENGLCNVTDLSWFLRLLQNSAGDAGSAGWWAVFVLTFLLFLDPEMRAKPSKLLDAFSGSGILISTLYLMFLAVSIIDFCLNFTALSDFIALDILGWLRGLDLGGSGPGAFQFLALLTTMFLAVLLGMGMPAVPAYINVALLMGPVLAGLGLSIFTAHMFVFYFAVASAITPPVAIAAFAAATITKAEPMATGFSAVRSGIVMFIIPFVFAMYPELLIIEAAVLDPSSLPSAKVYVQGYDGSFSVTALLWLVARLIFALYLLASALSRFDLTALQPWEWIFRIVLAGFVMAKAPEIYGTAIVIAATLVVWHGVQSKRSAGLAS